MVRLFIDPSINNTGLAIFCGKDLFFYGVIRTKNKGDDLARMNSLARSIVNWCMERKFPEEAYIEIPDYRYIDKNKKSMMLLNKAIGYLLGYLEFSFKMNQISVKEWKGTKTKDVTAYEIKHIYKKKMANMRSIAESVRNNAYDAIGLGHYVISQKGLFLRAKNKPS